MGELFDDPGDLGFFNEGDKDDVEVTDEDLSGLFNELFPGEGGLD